MNKNNSIITGPVNVSVVESIVDKMCVSNKMQENLDHGSKQKAQNGCGFQWKINILYLLQFVNTQTIIVYKTDVLHPTIIN